MSLQTVRFRTDNDTGVEVRSQLAKVFPALREASPRGVVCTANSSASETDFILALETAEDRYSGRLPGPRGRQYPLLRGQARR